MKGLPGFVRSYPAVVVALLTLAAVLVMLAADAESAARWTASIVVIAFALWTAIDMVRQLLRGHMGLDILALVAMVSALAVGEYLAALIVVLMLSGGEALEDYAAQRSKRDLDALLRHSPQVAHIDDGGTLRDVGVDEVAAGDVLIVRPSEVIPVDAELLSETGEFDTSSLTGESLPVSYSTGDEVLSGMVNGTAAVRVRALRGSADSQFQQIVRLVEEAESAKAPMVRLADRFALPFTVVSLAIAGIAWAVSGDPVRFAEVLVLATPCPLLIAAPVAFMGGLSRASRAGMVVKGGAVLEALSRVESAVFDKTGTLTAGTPALVDVRPAAGFEADELLSLAASAEQYSSHVLAVSIVAEARTRGLSVVEAQRAEEQATNGVVAVIEGREVVVGKPAYVDELVGGVEREPLADGEAAAYVAVDGEYAGALILADEVRPESAETVAWLRAHGVERQAMLTGDAEPTAKAIAARVGIDEVHAELLPADKVRLAGEMQPRPVLMVGDGVNDAPVLAAADIGIAMGAKGSTAAGEAADAVILRDRIDVVADSVHIARHTVRVATTAIWIGIALSLGLMLIATTGAIPAVAGALTQEFVDLAAILYALRALRPPERS